VGLLPVLQRQRIIRGPGRGSAAGAIVSYALGITDVDPLHYDLVFERFWNPGRAKGFPDIDNDFPKGNRKQVRQYLMDRWGADKVRTIGTTTRLKPKAAIDKAYKVCERHLRGEGGAQEDRRTTPRTSTSSGRTPSAGRATPTRASSRA
jgi:DNA polymerase III alpha subunit